MIILHLGFFDGSVFLWGETTMPDTGSAKKRKTRTSKKLKILPHPFVLGVNELRDLVKKNKIGIPGTQDEVKATAFLPSSDDMPLPSSPLLNTGDDENILKPAKIKLMPWEIKGLKVNYKQYISLATQYEGQDLFAPGVAAGADFKFICQLMVVAGSLVVRGSYMPDLKVKNNKYFPVWKPVIDSSIATSYDSLKKTMPHSCRCLTKDEQTEPDVPAGKILDTCVGESLEYLVRSSQKRKEPKSSAGIHELWACGLTSSSVESIIYNKTELEQFLQKLRQWQRPLLIQQQAGFKLGFRLEEPRDEDDSEWKVRYVLQSDKDPSLVISVRDAWLGNDGIPDLMGIEKMEIREYILQNLGKASFVCPWIEESLKTDTPDSHITDINQTFAFLTKDAQMLKQAGYVVFLPAWWSRKGNIRNIKARASVKSPSMKSKSFMSLDELVDINWKLVIGDQPITFEELMELSKLKAPLVKFRGEWVMLSAEEIQEAIDFWKNKPEKTTAGDMVKASLGVHSKKELKMVEVHSSKGWISDLLKNLDNPGNLKMMDQPEGFIGQMRPYQQRGLSWLDFLKKWGFGACLADDMGLGKTIQVLGLIQNDSVAGNDKPVLIVCPTSVIGNWFKEAEKFTPDLQVMVHHGQNRLRGVEFVDKAQMKNIVLTSYTLLQKDLNFLNGVKWGGIILDEAQNIKNAETKQAKAARDMKADYRIAMTGTPVENHVGELWSVMEFLNPGYLGSKQDFKQNFHIPIQVLQSRETAEKLKKLTGPFILRRLKTDKSIISDLPEKLEMKTWCNLTKEQASLYAAVAEELISKIEDTEGIERRGNVLAAMTKLKQICNHPLNFMKDNSHAEKRSGKLERLSEMMEEVILAGEKALIFTQYTEMGEILKQYLQNTYGKEVFYLHGGTPKARRDQMVEQFQNSEKAPFAFILSIKAGGTGLNLTGANHVFHYDRWWNPAVENQATDRAFRIGQKKTVEVHKFITIGTLEEKIDNMIETKKMVAESVVGTGEDWLTELSNSELRELLMPGKALVEV
ncbi:MAG: DEAD/DEAH box helicase [Firmicutes bacterium]|nr:DEAD/DEAH box helicase [Bacillota bacterium]